MHILEPAPSITGARYMYFRADIRPDVFRAARARVCNLGS